MKIKPFERNRDFELIIFLLIIIFVLTLLVAYTNAKLSEIKKTNYIIPKAYAGIYYGLEDSNVAIVVLNLKDSSQAFVATQVKEYFNKVSERGIE